MDSDPGLSNPEQQLLAQEQIVAARAVIADADTAHFNALITKFADGEHAVPTAIAFAKAVLACQSHPLLQEVFRHADNHESSEQLCRFFERISSDAVRNLVMSYIWNEKARKMIIAEMRGECWNGDDAALNTTLRIFQMPEIMQALRKAHDHDGYDKLVAIISHIGSKHDLNLVTMICGLFNNYLDKPSEQVMLDLLHGVDHASELYAAILAEINTILQRRDLRQLFDSLSAQPQPAAIFANVIRGAAIERCRVDGKSTIRVRTTCITLVIHTVQAWQHSHKLEKVLTAMAATAHSTPELRTVCTRYLKKANRLPARLAKALQQLLG